MKLKGMRAASRLKYGQTPWDRLSKRKLLRLVAAYHQALSSADSCLRMSRLGEGNPSPYWSKDGSGGIALLQAKWLFDLCGLNSDIGREKTYRMFYRNASSLLYPGLEHGRNWQWWICTACGVMTSNMTNTPPKTCKCDAEWRPFKLSDIRPDLVCMEGDA